MIVLVKNIQKKVFHDSRLFYYSKMLISVKICSYVNLYEYIMYHVYLYFVYFMEPAHLHRKTQIQIINYLTEVLIYFFLTY